MALGNRIRNVTSNARPVRSTTCWVGCQFVPEMCLVRPQLLMEVDAWLAPFRHFWSEHIDALERHLDRVEQKLRKKGKRR